MVGAVTDAYRTRLERALPLSVRIDLYGLSGRRKPTVPPFPGLRPGGQAVKACPYIELYGLTEEEIRVVEKVD
jgi:hypothetical protein